MADTDLLFRIKGDSSQLAGEFGKARSTIEKEVGEIQAATGGIATQFRKEFGYLPTISRQAVQETGTASRQIADVVSQAALKPLTTLEKEVLDVSKRFADKGLSKALSSETSRIIADSQRAVSALDTQVLGMRNSMALAEKESASLRFSGMASQMLLVGTAAVAAGAGLFALVKNASDAGAALYDMSIKTGFSVETLSTLKNIGQEANVSLSQIGVAMGFFDKALEATHQNNKKMIETFKDLGVSTKSNEVALRDLFTQINKMPPGYERITAAIKVFGKGGKDMVDIIEKSHGSIDVAMEKFRAFGTLVSTDSAKKADQFRNSMKDLEQQLAAIGRQIAETLMPIVQGMVTNFTHWLRDNKEAWSSWAKHIGYVLKGIAEVVRAAATIITFTLNQIDEALHLSRKMADAFLPGKIPTPEGLHMSGAAELLAKSAASDGEGPHLPDFAKAAKPKKPKKVADDEGRPDIQALDESNRAIIEKMRAANDAIKAEYDKGEKDRDAYYDEARLKLHLAMLDELANIEKQKIIAATRIKDKTKLNYELAKLEDAATKIRDTETKEKRKLDEQQDKEELDAKIAHLERANASQKFYEDKQLADTEEALARGLKYEDDVEQLRYENQQARLGREREILEERQKAYGEYAEQYKAITDQLEQNDADRLRSAELHARKMNEILIGIGQSDREKADQELLSRNMGTAPGINEQIRGMIGPPPDFTPHMDAIGALRDFAVSAWGNISQGFGQMIQAFLVGGNAAGQSFGKIAKAAIASVVAQAAVNAIFEYGMFLASLWLNPHAAATHLLAANTFALVAGVGAVAALAIPGGSSASQNQPVASRALGSSSSGSSSQSGTRVIDVNRNLSPQVIELHIKSNDSHIIKTIVDNIRGGGDVREVIVKDGTLAMA